MSKLHPEIRLTAQVPPRLTTPAVPVWILAVLAFCLMYQVLPAGAPTQFVLSRMAVVLLLGLAWWHGRNGIGLLGVPLAVGVGVILPYATALYFVGGDSGVLVRVVSVVVFGAIGAGSLAALAGTVNRFLAIWFSCAVVQSFVVIGVFFLPAFRESIISISSAGTANYEIAGNVYRSFGVSGYVGSALSIVQFTGFLAGLLLQRRAARDRSTHINMSLLGLGLILVFTSTVFVGRTGMVFCILFLVLTPPKMSLRSLAFTVPAAIVAIYIGVRFSAGDLTNADQFSQTYFNEWLLIAFQDPFSVLRSIWSSPVAPPIDAQSMVGTGLVSLTPFGTNPSGNDSGIIQTYFGYGAPMTALIYALYFVLARSAFRSVGVKMATLAGLAVVLLDAKEPFLFKYSLPAFLFGLYVAAKYEAGAQRGRESALAAELHSDVSAQDTLSLNARPQLRDEAQPT